LVVLLGALVVLLYAFCRGGFTPPSRLSGFL
jgi:hypothetical protein